jgi:peptidoglycan/LPS O-acetylase OafA/YrhL
LGLAARRFLPKFHRNRKPQITLWGWGLLMRYRSDIDGLRAISIAIVVLFHLGFSSLPGGFVGVDVFFVISGYLITGILVRDIEGGPFSLLSFYERRIKRILPALFVMLVIVIGLGSVFLMPGDYDTMARSAAYAVFSLSNIFFSNNTGYFDAISGTMPLLHTWSLAVEEQFYLVWPILLFVIAKLCRNNRVSMAAGLPSSWCAVSRGVLTW